MKLPARLLIFAFLVLGVYGTTEGSEPLPAVRNFRQIYESLISITQVDPSESQEVRDFYASSQARLPKDGKIEEITPPMLTTLASLSALFCDEMILNDSLLSGADIPRRRAHRQVDFSRGPSAMDSVVQKSVVQEYAQLFWSRPATPSEEKTLLDLMGALAKNEPDSPVGTRSLLTVACATVSDALDFILY